MGFFAGHQNDIVLQETSANAKHLYKRYL